MTRARRIVLWLTLPLLLLLAAAAFALSGPTKASAADAVYYPDLYTLRINTQIEGVMDYDNISVRLGFSETSAHPGYVTYYGMVQNFSSQLPAGKEVKESFETPPLEWYVNDRLICFYRIAYDKPLDLLTVDTWLHRDHCVLYKQQLTIEDFLSGAYYEIDCETLDEILRIQLNYRLNIGTSNIASLVTFKYKAFDDAWSEVSQLFYFGELPRLPDYYDGHWDRVFFKGWSPEIVPVTASDPVMYTAQYEYPSVLVKQKDGTVQREYLKWDYIDDELLLGDFTDLIDDIASTNVILGDVVNFINRKDFWYCQTADTETKHTIDTNLTLEAISFRLKDKETGVLHRLKAAENTETENKGFWGRLWGHLTYAWKTIEHTFKNWGESFLAAMQTLFTGEKDLQDEQAMDFLYEYYPAFAQEDPDHYELVYMYYYSVDLKDQIEDGTVEDGYFDYEDTYKDSVLEVTNNINGIGYSVTNSYSLEKGNYFVLDMARYWQSMGYITKEQFVEDYSAVRILNAKYRITTDHGEVVYDTALAADIQQALTTVVYYYTGDFHPNYADSYSLNVIFYDVTVYKEADKVLPEQIKDWLQPMLDFFAKVGAWFKKYGLWILAAVLAIPVIWLLVIAVKWIVKICKRVANALHGKPKQPPKARHKKRRAKR